MIQRIQSVYLLVAFILMLLAAYFLWGRYVLVAFAVVAAIASMATIFLYKNRPRQAMVCKILCGLGVVFAVWVFTCPPAVQTDFVWTIVVTLAAALCWLLASRAIMKDEKLVRSLDRIR